ncbi:MAG TPA: hypothetical protein VHQ90_19815 [Thermoanaerobaculia bacterium]|nr:hypothetical protein [Thermoanaerobaculia bacterium]
MAADLQKEVAELKTKLTRLEEYVERLGWGNPHDIAYQTLGYVDFIRSYYASGAAGVEMIRQMVEMLRVTATGCVGVPSSGVRPAFLYGLADLIQGVYLENRYNQEVHAAAVTRRREEQLRARTEGAEGEKA